MAYDPDGDVPDVSLTTDDPEHVTITLINPASAGGSNEALKTIIFDRVAAALPGTLGVEMAGPPVDEAARLGYAISDYLDVDATMRRLKALPGFGDQKARIFLALLGKQYGVNPPGWRTAAGAYGDPDARMSIADVVDKGTLEQVRAYKKKMKAATKSQAAVKSEKEPK